MAIDLNPFDEGFNPAQLALELLVAGAAIKAGKPLVAKGLAQEIGIMPVSYMVKHPVTAARLNIPALNYKQIVPRLNSNVIASDDIIRTETGKTLAEGFNPQTQIIQGTTLSDNLPDELYDQIVRSGTGGIVNRVKVPASQFEKTGFVPRDQVKKKITKGSVVESQAYTDLLNNLRGNKVVATTKSGKAYGNKFRKSLDYDAMGGEAKDAAVNNATNYRLQLLVNRRKAAGDLRDSEVNNKFKEEMLAAANLRPEIVDEIALLSQATGLPLEDLLVAYAKASGGTNAAGNMNRVKSAIDVAFSNIREKEKMLSSAGRVQESYETPSLINSIADQLVQPGGIVDPAAGKTRNLLMALRNIAGFKNNAADTVVLDTNDLRNILALQSRNDTVPDYIMREPELLYQPLTDSINRVYGSKRFQDLLGEITQGSTSKTQSVLMRGKQNGR